MNLDQVLGDLVKAHGPLVYAILFAVVFCETGLVILPFLPGDSLLFAVGAISAQGAMNYWIASAVMIMAAILGDAVNYAIGRYVGPRIFRKENPDQRLGKLLNRKHLDRAREFFVRHGGKSVLLARFVPIVRTFIPFVAGAGAMDYPKFAFYNILGAFVWVVVCTTAGYFFGNIPIVKENFEWVVVGVIIVSLLPLIGGVIRARFSSDPVKPAVPPVPPA